MTALSLSLSALAGRTGRGVRIAVIDSGVHAAHPHVGRLAGAVAFDDDGQLAGDGVDRLGHGTAVAAAIHEKAPEADLLAVKVFDRSLASTGRALEAAIAWAAAQNVTLINLSLGTTNHDHRPRSRGPSARRADAGAIVIAAAPDAEHDWLPGGLAGVVPVALDWECARDVCHVSRGRRGSSHPRVGLSTADSGCLAGTQRERAELRRRERHGSCGAGDRGHTFAIDRGPRGSARAPWQ